MQKTVNASGRKPPRAGFIGLVAGVFCIGLLLAGCTAKHYRKAADKEVYRIIQQVEDQVFGRTNTFTIDTKYSNRKPETILPSELIEDRLGTNRRVVTIEMALDLAVRESRRYQAEKERLYLSALTLTGARYEFGPQFFARSSATLSTVGGQQTSLGIANDVGVSQAFKTGGALSVALANDILRYFTGDPRRSVVNLASARLVQPLLRGFGRNNPAVEALTQAERNVIYAVRQYAYFQDGFALEIVNDYFSLVAQKDIIRNRYTNYLSRVQSTQRLEERAHDRESLNDVDQARQAELTAKNNYINSLATFQGALDLFLIKLGLPVGEKWVLDDHVLTEVEERGLVPVNLPVETAYRVAVEKQLIILNAIEQFEDRKRKIRIAKNRFLPDLNLSAGASWESERPTDYTTFDPDNIRADVGLIVDLPVDRFRERNDYRATLVTFETELRNLTLALDTLKESIQGGLRNLNQRRQNYEIQKNALKLANRRVESTTLLLEAGRAEIRDLVEAQDAQILAQNSVLSALVDYQETRLELMQNIGALETDTPKFWLQDHLVNFLKDQAVPAQTVPPGEIPVGPPENYFHQ